MVASQAYQTRTPSTLILTNTLPAVVVSTALKLAEVVSAASMLAKALEASKNSKLEFKKAVSASSEILIVPASMDLDLSEDSKRLSPVIETSEISKESVYLMEEKVAHLKTLVTSEDSQVLLTATLSLVVLMVSAASKDSTSLDLATIIAMPLELIIEVETVDSLQEDQEISATDKTDLHPMVAHMVLTLAVHMVMVSAITITVVILMTTVVALMTTAVILSMVFRIRVVVLMMIVVDLTMTAVDLTMTAVILLMIVVDITTTVAAPTMTTSVDPMVFSLMDSTAAAHTPIRDISLSLMADMAVSTLPTHTEEDPTTAEATLAPTDKEV